MRILHAGWGFRPWRGGGLIAYAEDVMEAQAARGNDVAYLFGGRRYPLMRGPRLHRWRRRDVQMLEILSCPIPVGIDRGTRFPELDLDEPATESLVDRALADFAPDVLNLQEFLGLPSSIVEIAHARGVPVVMPLHDYFPLCPTVKLFDADGRVCMRRDPAPECVRCCRDAPLGTRHIREMTLAFELQRAGRALPRLRGPALGTLSRVLPRMPTGLPIDTRALGRDEPPAPESSYRRRREVNLARLARIDMLVGASTRITEIYAQLGVPSARLRTVHLVAGHIAALRPRTIESPPRPVRFATLAGAQNEQKGASVLVDALQRLSAEAPSADYSIDVHGLVGDGIRAPLERLPRVRIHGPYTSDALDSILESADVGIVPSVWEDTYPHAGLELLAKGIPVIGNARGGIPDYTIPGETGWLNRSCTGAELAEIMAGVIADPSQVVRLNGSIRERRDELVKPLDRHLDELDEIYAEVLSTRR
jgi:glycosyltransferase involved in cell wall biosynthesis